MLPEWAFADVDALGVVADPDTLGWRIGRRFWISSGFGRFSFACF